MMFKTYLATAKTQMSIVKDERLRLCLWITLLLALAFVGTFNELFLQAGVVGTESQQDYNAFHAAGRAALYGIEGNLYDPIVFQQAMGGESTLLWLYPPHMLFILMPVGALPYGVAKFVLIGLTLAFGYFVFRLISGSKTIGLIGMLSPATYVTIRIGQMSGLFATLMTAGLLLLCIGSFID